MKKSTQSSTANNVATFLRTVHEKEDSHGDPHEIILGVLAKSPANFTTLKRLTNLPFADLDAALTRLQNRKLINEEDDNEGTKFSLTLKGKEYAALP